MKINESGVSERSSRYLFTPSSFAERIFFYMTRLGHFFCDRRYHFGYQCDIALQAGHRLNYMLFLIKSGQMHLEIEGRCHTLSSGAIALFDCRRPHQYHALTDDLEFYWLVFNGAQSALLYQQILDLHGGQQVFSCADTAQIQAFFTRLLTYCDLSERIPEHICSETIYCLLCHLLAGSSENDGFDGLISRALAYMDSHFSEKLSVETVAAHVGLSASYFTKQFRQRTGYSPYEYITLQRIDYAKELLLTSQRTIGQIAFETGYQSEENFIRAFKKKVGLSPASFRRYPI